MTIRSRRSLQTLKELEAIMGGPLTLANCISSIRQCEEMTQVEFAALLGISKQNLCDIEHGRRLLSPKLAAEYAEKLGYSVEQFVRLALQAIVDRDGIPFHVELEAA